MAGTEDYSFYGSVENSPFWVKRSDLYDTSNEGIQKWEKKLTASASKYDKDDGYESSQPNPGLGIMRLVTDNLIAHPFLVVRRQCQVNVFSRKYHLLPFSLIPVVVRLHQRQGMTVLWKGIGSGLIVKGLTLAVEDILSKITPWPKEIDRNSSLKAIGHHLLLKSVSLAVVIPFYAASVVEAVQSDIASEKPGIFDVFQEGFCRLLSWSAPQTGRLLPIWIIVCPAVICGTLHYAVSVLATGLTRWGVTLAKKRNQRKQGALSKEMNSMEASDLELTSRFAGSLVADILLFPFETVLHRLHIQGTRTIIDNLDTGSSVIPILTRYDGFFDCWSTITREEGRWGLYKGFGALVLQHALQLSIIKGSLFTFHHMADLFKPASSVPAGGGGGGGISRSASRHSLAAQQQPPTTPTPPTSGSPRRDFQLNQ